MSITRSSGAETKLAGPVSAPALPWAAPGARRLILTFDDGPDEYWTRCVLEVCRQARVQATFFVLGEKVDALPQLARAVVEQGHDVQLHAHRHVRHSELSEAEIEHDTVAALAALERVGVRPSFWRTPWGVCTPASERVAARHGLALVHWSIDTHDWRGDSAATMLSRARRRDGGVVLMHDALGPGSLRLGAQNTVELLPKLIAEARSAGVSVGALAGERVVSPVAGDVLAGASHPHPHPPVASASAGRAA